MQAKLTDVMLWNACLRYLYWQAQLATLVDPKGKDLPVPSQYEAAERPSCYIFGPEAPPYTSNTAHVKVLITKA